VFRALNMVETVLAVAVIAAVVAGGPSADVAVFTAVAGGLLFLQLAVIRPVLSRRSDWVLAGGELPRSRAHLYYVAFEVAKVLALAGLGASILVAVRL
jgi:hypothetical protein